MIAKALILLARAWQNGPSRVLPPSCRFTPSCSAYAITAWTRYGAIEGTWLTAKRLLRCNPWGGCGPDPVPMPPRTRAAISASKDFVSDRPA